MPPKSPLDLSCHKTDVKKIKSNYLEGVTDNCLCPYFWRQLSVTLILILEAQKEAPEHNRIRGRSYNYHFNKFLSGMEQRI